MPEKKSKKNQFFSVPNLLYTPYGRVSEKQFFFYRKFFFWEKKIRPTGGGSVVPQGGLQGGVVPQGGLQGGVGPEKKKFPKKSQKKYLALIAL